VNVLKVVKLIYFMLCVKETETNRDRETDRERERDLVLSEYPILG
jgi:hypothetical protein